MHPFVRDLQRLAALQEAMRAAPRRRRPGELQLEEIEPGVWAVPAERPRLPGELGALVDQAEHITGLFRDLQGRLCR